MLIASFVLHACGTVTTVPDNIGGGSGTAGTSGTTGGNSTPSSSGGNSGGAGGTGISGSSGSDAGGNIGPGNDASAGSAGSAMAGAGGSVEAGLDADSSSNDVTSTGGHVEAGLDADSSSNDVTGTGGSVEAGLDADSSSNDARDAADAEPMTSPPGPSCTGLVATCGPNGISDCCASGVVKGGIFNRSNDATYPATISDFRLDNYEITVGRFRKFVATYSETMTRSGTGKNPNNPADPGWDGNWNLLMPSDAATLATAVKCNGTAWTDSPGANESRPMGCITWYEAYAFCIWDGGRLPTQAEWNYAAAGGSEQRQYPWSSPPSNTTIDCTYANYIGAGNGTDFCVAAGTGMTNNVGSESPKGDGKWGQSDLAGNIDEWVEDWIGTPPVGAPSLAYPNPCINCFNATPSVGRVLAGSAYNHSASALLTTYKAGNGGPSVRSANFGARCARSP